MANIKNMKMADVLFANPNIEIKKAYYGLKTIVTYKPTKSPVAAYQLEFAPEYANKLADLLRTPDDKIEEVAKKLGELTNTPNGNVRLEVCVSKDKQFVAAQLLQFRDFDYHAVSEVRIIEGELAATLANLFV